MHTLYSKTILSYAFPRFNFLKSIISGDINGIGSDCVRAPPTALHSPVVLQPAIRSFVCSGECLRASQIVSRPLGLNSKHVKSPGLCVWFSGFRSQAHCVVWCGVGCKQSGIEVAR